MRLDSLGRWPALSVAITLVGCTVGPDYEVASAPAPTQYKELKGWRIANPRDDVDRGSWWSVYRDPLLDKLERQVEINNQTLKESEAAFRQSQALVQEARAQLFPTITLTPRRHPIDERERQQNLVAILA
jgi:outer membrane protein TolC